MRNTTLLVFLLLSQITLSQQKELEIWNPPIGQDRFLVGFNNNSWLDIPDGIELRPYSPGVNAYIMYDYPFTQKSKFGFAWGYGFDSHNVHHNGTFVRDTIQGAPYTSLTPFDSNYDFRKNKLAITYIEVPAEFRFRTRGENQFKLYLGGRIGYLVSVHTKTVDDEGKRKFYGMKNIEKLRYGVQATIGLNAVAITGFYSMTTIFDEKKGVPLRPFSIGLTFFLL